MKSRSKKSQVKLDDGNVEKMIVVLFDGEKLADEGARIPIAVKTTLKDAGETRVLVAKGTNGKVLLAPLEVSLWPLFASGSSCGEPRELRS